MYVFGIKAQLDEELIVQTIINNMKCKEKTFVRLHMRNKCKFSDFINIIETIESENKAQYNNTKIEIIKTDENEKKMINLKK
jgi:hypothetical protein